MTKKRKRLLSLLLILLVGLVTLGVTLSNRTPKVVVQTGHVERVEVLDSIVSASGEVRAKEFVDLQTEIAGVIIELPVEEGQRVRAGDVLLRIDPFQSRQDLASAQAQFDAADAEAGSALVQVATAEAVQARDEFAVAASESEVTETESNRDRLKKQLERKRGLYEQRIVSSDDFEAAESALSVAESQVLSAKARLDQSRAERDLARVSIEQWRKQHEASTRRVAAAQANLERMQDLFQKTTISSPLSGVITRLNVEKGERAVPGILSNPQATLMTIADLSTIEAEIKVDETDIIRVSIGDRAKVTIDALPDQPLEGRVTEIGNSPIGSTSDSLGTTSQEGKDFKVVVQIENPPDSLRPGLSASAEIFVDRREDALVIPLQAVTVREVDVDDEGLYHAPSLEELERKRSAEPEAQAASSAPADVRKVPKKELEGVFVLDTGHARFRPVKLGITGESDVEVADGLSEGEEIVTGSYKILRTIKDGDLVTVENHATELALRKPGSRGP
jgi:HlyD family secretion protein